MARPRKPLPKTFVHFRATEQLTSALDEVADAQNITRSEVARIILELYLFDDVNRIAMSEGLNKVRSGVKIATAQAFKAFQATFAQTLADVQRNAPESQSLRPPRAFDDAEDDEHLG